MKELPMNRICGSYPKFGVWETVRHISVVEAAKLVGVELNEAQQKDPANKNPRASTDVYLFHNKCMVHTAGPEPKKDGWDWQYWMGTEVVFCSDGRYSLLRWTGKL